MRISVALCTHQGAAYVEAQLRSIIDQTRAVDEIVVCDDASSDATLSIVERIASTSPIPVHITRNDPALGVVANFSDAIARTTGDVIALSDQDDVWHPDRIARMLAVLDGVDLVHSDARLVDAAGDPLGMSLLEALELSDREANQMQHGGAFDALLRRNLVTGATVVVRRSAAVAALPVPAAWVHDEWIAMVCALRGGVRLLPEPTIDYRQHGNNQIGARRLTLPQKFGRLVEPDRGAHERKAVRSASRARAAADRALGSAAQRAQLDAKAEHDRARSALPRMRLARVPIVVRGLVRGNYGKYSRGILDVARDLVASRRRDAPASRETPD